MNYYVHVGVQQFFQEVVCVRTNNIESAKDVISKSFLVKAVKSFFIALFKTIVLQYCTVLWYMVPLVQVIIATFHPVLLLLLAS
jgi:hypothetical protein